MMDSTNRIALLQQAESADAEGNHEEALGIISRCLDLYPAFSPARVLRGEILVRLGRTDDAVDELDAIIRSNPENIRARILLTRTLAEAGKSQDAMTHLEFLGFMMPENDPALLELHELLNRDTRKPPVQIDDPTIIEEPETPVEAEEAVTDFSDTVTEVFVAADLAVSDDEGNGLQEDAGSEEEQEQELEPIVDEAVAPEDIVTSHLTNDEPMESDVPAEEDVQIKTRTMALVYEKQGMLQDALDVLISLRGERPNPELEVDIERIQRLMRVDTKREVQRDGRAAVRRLKNWLEKIHAVP